MKTKLRSHSLPFSCSASKCQNVLLHMFCISGMCVSMYRMHVCEWARNTVCEAREQRTHTQRESGFYK